MIGTTAAASSDVEPITNARLDCVANSLLTAGTASAGSPLVSADVQVILCPSTPPALLIALYASIETARHGQVWGDLKRRSASRERRLEYQEDHRALVAALRARNAAAAIEAMRTHLARVADHLLGQSQ